MGRVEKGAAKQNSLMIESKINEFISSSTDNRFSFMEDYIIFGQPLIKFADGSDKIFKEYKTIISSDHLTPREAFSAKYQGKEAIPEQLSVISWILPIVEKTRISNRNATSMPSREWSHTRWYGEKFNDLLRNFVVYLLAGLGYRAVAPMAQSYFKIQSNQKGAYSNWSERHIAYAAGQGTFSLSDGLITEAGIAHRCGSVVTDMILPASSRTAKSPFSNCLFHLGIKCKSCITRCPADAITEKGHDKNKCQEYMRKFGYAAPQISDYDNDKTIVGCGLCQTKVPCEYENPAKHLKVQV
jgi:epoxyqueuosine reductase